MENDSELVLDRVMEDGTFDELRKMIVDRLKQDVRHSTLWLPILPPLSSMVDEL